MRGRLGSRFRFSACDRVEYAVLGSAWLIASIVLIVVAAAILGLVVLPRRGRVLDRCGERLDQREPAGLAMATGLLNLARAAVTALMIVRPGSSTGVRRVRKQKSVRTSVSASPTI